MLTCGLDPADDRPLYEQVYAAIRSAIEAGEIGAGEKLPSKRMLAEHLGLSVITVEAAYSQLMAEGYIRSVQRRGYFAERVTANANPDATFERRSATAIRPFAGEAVSPYSAARSPVESVEASQNLIADFAANSVDSSAFPFSVWSKAVRDAISNSDRDALICETPAFGCFELRHAIADHLRGFRGLDVDPACIVVGAGAQVLYNLLVQLLGRDRIFAVEDPGYARLVSIYRANGAPLRHVPMDSGGIRIDALRGSGANVAHLMPSHQFPTGAVMGASRRFELLNWADESPHRFIIEDDFDCEFRFAGRPVASLKSIDRSGRVIYANTFAKSLGPAFRIGYLVLPSDLARRFSDELGFYSCTVSAVDQLALARFIRNGDFERHINRMRACYRSKRDALISALGSLSFADRIEIAGQDAGLHFIMQVEGVDELAFADRAMECGVRLLPLSRFCFGASDSGDGGGCGGGAARFVMCFAGFDASRSHELVQALELAL